MLKINLPTWLLTLPFLWLSISVSGQSKPDTTTARALYQESVGLTGQEQYRTAKERLWEATRILEQAGAQETALYATVLHQRGVIFIKTVKPDSALILNRAALALREKLFGHNSEPVYRSLLNIGQAYYGKMDFKKVLEYTQMALKVAKALPPGSEEFVASAYNNLSNASMSMSNLPTALLYADSALHIRQTALKIDSVNLAISYNNMGNLYTLSGKPIQAVQSLEKGLALRLAHLGKWHRETASGYCNLGAAVYYTGDNERALDLIQTSLEIRRKVIPADDLEMAESFANLMLPLIPLGDYDRAIEYGLQATSICKKYGGRGIPILAITHMAWGNALVYKDEPDEAIQHFESAFNFFTLTRNVPFAAEALNNIGAAYGQKRDFQNQKKYMQQALDRKASIRKDHPDLAISYINLGLAYQNNGQLDSTLLLLQQAEAQLVRTSSPSSPYYVTLHNTRALALAQKGDFDAALTELETAKRANRYEKPGMYQHVGHLDNLLTTLTETGGIWRSRTDKLLQPHYLENAQAAYLEAYNVVKFQRTALLEPGSKAAINKRVFPLHEALIATDLALSNKNQTFDYRQEAFRFAESSKSFNLLLAFTQSGAKLFANIPPDILAQEQTLKAEIKNLEKNRSIVESQTPRNELLLDSIQRRLLAQKDEYLKLQQHIQRQFPEYFTLKYQASEETVQSAQTLLRTKQVLLEYFVGDSNIYLFVVRPDTLIVREVKRDFPLEDWIDQFRKGLYGYYTADKGKRDTALYNSTVRQYTEFSHKLYQKLFAPAEPFLYDQGSVVIVPDGPLGYVPFDALLTGKPEDPLDFKSYPYLLNKHQFSYTYSATLLKEMRDKKHHQEPSKEFAAFAPFYNGDTTLLAGLYKYDELMRKDLQPLAYSGPEVAAASELMHGEIVAGPAATEERFMSTASDYRILHLATHGRADNRVGDYAFLAFSELKDSIENELLYVKDLYNLELNADLVVLSACETGIGKLQRGEGIISLARAFAYAGAKSIVTTLWEVNDKSTSELMRYFYRELQLGKNKDEALRLARQRYFDKAAPRGLHPFFWAAFVPVGDMRPVR